MSILDTLEINMRRDRFRFINNWAGDQLQNRPVNALLLVIKIITAFWLVWVWVNTAGIYCVLGLLLGISVVFLGAWLDAKLPDRTKKLWPEKATLDTKTSSETK